RSFFELEAMNIQALLSLLDEGIFCGDNPDIKQENPILKSSLSQEIVDRSAVEQESIWNEDCQVPEDSTIGVQAGEHVDEKTCGSRMKIIGCR
ncbi:hypothetical protein BGZ65_006907, partial [Modicella reniformis]